jgi:hypothetical protein
MNDVAFWDMTPYDSSKNRRFVETYRLRLQGTEILSLPRSPGGDMFLRNVGHSSWNHAASYSRR